MSHISDDDLTWTDSQLALHSAIQAGGDLGGLPGLGFAFMSILRHDVGELATNLGDEHEKAREKDERRNPHHQITAAMIQVSVEQNLRNRRAQKIP